MPLLHQTLDDVFDNLYDLAYKALRAGLNDVPPSVRREEAVHVALGWAQHMQIR